MNSSLVGLIISNVVVILSDIVSLFVRLVRSRKTKLPKTESIKYIQEYMQSTYVLSLCPDLVSYPYDILNEQKRLTLGVYSHIPERHWALIEKIKEAVQRKDNKAIGDFLMLLSQSLASDGIETKLDPIEPQKFTGRNFEGPIVSLSPSFVKIFNQAAGAEAMGLDEIAGIGYRKALEFLIKDYLIHSFPDDEEEIKKGALGLCIRKISNEKLRTTASRSAWIGNDMTHYVRRMEGRDIKDMKSFIDAAIYWISEELVTEDASSIEKATPK